ncbi:MAG TPA: hypothetical protein VMS55_27235 [Myxococcota bacterium]|nr:hypothetical protein [Myxococcota bacterium]
MVYEPYPLGSIAPAFEPDLYGQLLRQFPPLELFEFLPDHGNKYSLSEKYHPKQYADFVTRHEVWRDLRAYVKSDAFRFSVIDALRDCKVDLGIRRKSRTLGSRSLKLLREAARGHLPSIAAPITSRFEFSALPASSGHLAPHTDSPGKLITLVVTMTRDGEWDSAWGGGTDILKPKDASDSYNYSNRQIPYEQCEVLRTVEFVPNQALLFIKTFNSLHGVRPMKGPEALLRRTLTLNIEEGH